MEAKKKKNEEVLSLADPEISLKKATRRGQMKCMQHVFRKRGLEHLSIAGKQIAKSPEENNGLAT